MMYEAKNDSEGRVDATAKKQMIPLDLQQMLATSLLLNNLDWNMDKIREQMTKQKKTIFRGIVCNS